MNTFDEYAVSDQLLALLPAARVQDGLEEENKDNYGRVILLKYHMRTEHTALLEQFRLDYVVSIAIGERHRANQVQGL